MAFRRAKTRVLLADDNPQCLRIWAGIVERQCDVVATAKDGLSALELIRRLKPSVAVLDCEMPGRTGIEILYELASQLEKPAVVICSVDCSAELISAARDAGALGFVAKQYSGRDLLPAIEAARQLQPFFPTTHNPGPDRGVVRSKPLDDAPIITVDL